MTASVNRKNLGKQFTCTDATRFIFHWHRPGDPLPVLVRHAGETYKLTQAHIDRAKAMGHTSLIPIEVNDTQRQQLALSHTFNGKGAQLAYPDDEGTKLGLAGSLGLYAVATAFSVWALVEISKVFA